MFELFRRLKIARAMGRLIEDPTRTDEIFKLSRIGRQAKNPVGLQAMLEFIEQKRDFIDLWKSGYRPPLPTLEALRAYPTGTLGAAYYVHLNSNGLQPDFFPSEPVAGLLEFTIQRLRQTHDLWHVLVGFDTSVPGEIGLQAFSLAQVRNVLSVVLLFGGMMHLALKSPRELPLAMDKIVDGYTRGKAARFLLAERWEELLGESLLQARQRVGL